MLGLVELWVVVAGIEAGAVVTTVARERRRTVASLAPGPRVEHAAGLQGPPVRVPPTGAPPRARGEDTSEVDMPRVVAGSQLTVALDHLLAVLRLETEQLTGPGLAVTERTSNDEASSDDVHEEDRPRVIVPAGRRDAGPIVVIPGGRIDHPSVLASSA